MPEREERRLKRSLENSRLFLGPLSQQQESSLVTHVKNNPFPSEEQLKNNKQNFEKLKLASTSPEVFQKFILDYIQNWRDHQSTIYLKLSDDLRKKNEVYFQELVCQASTKQLKHLRQKLSEIKRFRRVFYSQTTKHQFNVKESNLFYVFETQWQLNLICFFILFSAHSMNMQ